EQTRVIIEGLYMKKRPSLTLIGLAQELFISKSQAYKLKNHIFEAVEDELGM
ncbi:transcriptional regulator, partial [Enterococcus faecalis]